jgi:hypothetical protein
VFAVRFVHDGPYARPRGANLFGGLGALVLGGVRAWPATPRGLGRLALGVSPVVLLCAAQVQIHTERAAGTARVAIAVRAGG